MTQKFHNVMEFRENPETKRQNVHEEPLPPISRKKVIHKNDLQKITELVLQIVIFKTFFFRSIQNELIVFFTSRHT